MRSPRAMDHAQADRELARLPIRLPERTPAQQIRLMVAVEEFTSDWPCNETMSGLCADYKAVSPTGSSSQDCHTTDAVQLQVTQVRTGDCQGGADLNTSVPATVMAGDLVYAWWNPQALRWEVLQHIYTRCSYYCGWSAARNGTLVGQYTDSGDMVFAIDAGALHQTGTGEAFASMTVNLSSFATSPLTIKCRPRVPLSSATGKFTFGFIYGPGVVVDLDAETVSYVTLDGAGAVATTYNTVSYPASMWGEGNIYGGGPTPDAVPTAEMGWCWLDCERLTVLGLGHDSSNLLNSVTPLALWPVDQPNSDAIMTFRSTVPADVDGIDWLVVASCGALCETCMQYTDWPTPGQATVSGPSGMTVSTTAPKPVDGSSFADLSGDILSSFLTDPDGVQFVTGPGAGVIGTTCGQIRIADPVTVWTDGTNCVTATASVQMWIDSPPPVTMLGFYYGTSIVDWGAIPTGSSDGKTFIAVAVTFTNGICGEEYPTKTTNLALYKYDGHLPESSTPATFTLVAVVRGGCTEGWRDGHCVPMDADDPLNAPFIEPTSWPSSIGAGWVPTAPACDEGPPSTTTSTEPSSTTTTEAPSTTTTADPSTTTTAESSTTTTDASSTTTTADPSTTTTAESSTTTTDASSTTTTADPSSTTTAEPSTTTTAEPSTTTTADSSTTTDASCVSDPGVCTFRWNFDGGGPTGAWTWTNPNPCTAICSCPFPAFDGTVENQTATTNCDGT